MTDNDLVVDPVLRMRSKFTRATEDGEDVLYVETWVDPGGGVTPHVHPAMDEKFEVLDGTMEFLAGRRWTPSRAGETVAVPRGTRHAFRNRSTTMGHIRCRVTPPSTLQAFLEGAATLSRSGAITRHGLPRSLTGLLRAAVLADDHREMVTLLAPLPPLAIQRLIIPPLARLARRRGLA
jgi:quercetin dioxygenase-like cupin family protein